MREMHIQMTDFEDTTMTNADAARYSSYLGSHRFFPGDTIATNEHIWGPCSKYAIHVIFFTGGSFEDGQSGSAVIMRDAPTKDIAGKRQRPMRVIDQEAASGRAISSYEAEIQAMDVLQTLINRNRSLQQQRAIFTDSLSPMSKMREWHGTCHASIWAKPLCEMKAPSLYYWAHVHGGNIVGKMALQYRIRRTNAVLRNKNKTWGKYSELLTINFKDRQIDQLHQLSMQSYTARRNYWETIGYCENEFLPTPNGMEDAQTTRIVLNLRNGNSILISQYRAQCKIGNEDARHCIFCGNVINCTAEHMI